MDQRFEVFTVDPTAELAAEPGNPENLYLIIGDLLVTAGMKSGNPAYVPLATTLEHVLSLSPQCLLVQRNVQDPDFIAEHAAYYSRWTAPVPRYCKRLHFFSVPPQSEDPIEVIDQMMDEPESYLGFITLRPISTNPVAASILRPSTTVPVHYVLSRDDFPVNLAGRTFNVNGTPFMQQDNAVGACAQASILMALRTLRRKEGRAAFSPSQITTAATRFLVQGRTLPNRTGLSFEQIAEAIRAAGYATHLIPLRGLREVPDRASLDEAKRALYPYIESGIPVLILVYPQPNLGHAVLLIGHGWDADPWNPIALGELNNPLWHHPIAVIDASTWVEPCYVHNDNTGPYMPFPENSTDTYSLAHAVSAIPFLPSDVYIDAKEAQATCMKLLADTLSDFTSDALGENAGEKYEMPQLVGRLYLLDKAEFRAAVYASDMPENVKDYYRKKWLPKRIWIMELNAFTGYEQAPEGNTARLGEILLDPASEPEDGAFLSIHLSRKLLPPRAASSVIVDRDAIDGSIRALPVTEADYSPLTRTI